MPISEIINFIRGSREYKISPECSDKAAGIISMSGADFRRMKRCSDGLTFRLFERDVKAVEGIFKKHCVEFTVTKRRGLSYLIHRYRRRPGIIVGALLFSLILFISGRFIWTVEVVGNDKISDSEIITRLDSLGCGVGTPIGSIDFNSLQNRFLLKYEDISWISVNLRGTSATVEVLEMQDPVKAPDKDTPYNLIASETGVIDYVEILRGKPVVTEGVLVKKGELLASGVEEMKHGYRLVHAMGKVMAQVRREVDVAIPIEATRLSPTGKVFSEKYLNIFGISLKFFSNIENMSSEYDKIEYKSEITTDELCFFDTVRVPVSVEALTFTEYEHVPVTYTEEEAKAMAYEKLRLECERVTSDAELVSREIEAGINDGVYTIHCELIIVKNIAEEAPIYRDDASAK